MTPSLRRGLAPAVMPGLKGPKISSQPRHPFIDGHTPITLTITKCTFVAGPNKPAGEGSVASFRTRRYIAGVTRSKQRGLVKKHGSLSKSYAFSFSGPRSFASIITVPVVSGPESWCLKRSPKCAVPAPPTQVYDKLSWILNEDFHSTTAP